jgi:endonuclease YncB( thermonuclease family)
MVIAALSLPAGVSFAQLCPRGGNTFGRVVSVDERLDLTLDDGTRLKIGSIDPARPTPDNPDLDIRGREILANWLVGQSVEFRPIEPRHDRWGRVTAMVFAPAGEIAEGQSQLLLPVGEAIIDAGLARYAASVANDTCRGVLLAAEAQARASALGLWADPYYAVIAAGDRDSLAEKAGSTVIVEGRVAGLKVRKPLITLYFAPRRGAEFSVTVLPRDGKAFAAAQTRLAGSTGQDIRVRGLLDMRFGPQIEITDLDALEVVGQGQIAARSAE